MWVSMVPQEVIQKINFIRLETRRLLRQSRAGENSSAVKGAGFDFDQIRDYQSGDDVRHIDWNSSARVGSLLVKQFIQERIKTVTLLVDYSASHEFSSTERLKSQTVLYSAAVVALVAEATKDQVSLCLFDKEVATFVPPQRGRQHTQFVMNQLFTHKPLSQGTSIANALQFIAARKLKESMVIIVSDFIDTGYERDLKIMAQKHDIIVLRCLDKNERHFPTNGLVSVCDPETGQEALVDAQSLQGSSLLDKRIQEQNGFFKECGVDYLDVASDDTFINDIVGFFRSRMMFYR